ncbi:MAG: hypothetical protein ACMUEL_03590 [Flavobacteriales bacterium Tduv]
MSKNRWGVERTFGNIKRWFGSGKAPLQRISLCAYPASYGGYGS